MREGSDRKRVDLFQKMFEVSLCIKIKFDLRGRPQRSVHFKRGSPTAELIMSKFSSAGQMLHELRPKCDCQTGTTVRIFSLWVQIEVGVAVPSLMQLCRNTRTFTVSNFGHSPVADISCDNGAIHYPHVVKNCTSWLEAVYRGDFNSLASCQFVNITQLYVEDVQCLLSCGHSLKWLFRTFGHSDIYCSAVT